MESQYKNFSKSAHFLRCRKSVDPQIYKREYSVILKRRFLRNNFKNRLTLSDESTILYFTREFRAFSDELQRTLVFVVM